VNIEKYTNIKKALRCPICSSAIESDKENGRSLFCTGKRRHCYDLASGGYVNLTLPGQSNGGDSKGAVRARSAFLDTEHYRPVADMLCELLKKHCEKGALVIDAGCGEGYYSTSVAKCGFGVVGFDLSKFATDAGAKRAKRERLENTFFGTASVFTMPICDESADAVVNVFAPCVEAEYSRVLNSKGVLIVVYAGPEHLWGLKEAIYEHVHTNEERADLPSEMALAEKCSLTYDITVKGNENIQNLFAMTPYYWKTSQSDVQKLCGIDELTTRIDMVFAVYKKANSN
jgi:23S rRNA (guanine745-N1)-methyltransferase